MAETKKIVSEILGTGRTKINNINNINYTNNINDINYNVCVSDTIKEKTPGTPSASSGLASLSSGESFSSGVGNPGNETLPRNWRGLKIDIFDNSPAKDQSLIKIGLGVIKADGTTQNLRALMNSPARHVWRKVEPKDQHNAHWSLVREIQEDFKQSKISFRCSKFLLPNKGNATDFVGFLSETETQWLFLLIINGRKYDYWIDKKGTTSLAQRRGNIIASKFIGKEHQPLLTAEDLGL